jgi:hypothetical protein
MNPGAATKNYRFDQLECLRIGFLDVWAGDACCRSA